jgi:hypothetical protein
LIIGALPMLTLPLNEHTPADAASIVNVTERLELADAVTVRCARAE